MSNAFGVSEDDVWAVLMQDSMNSLVTDEDVSGWMDDLDLDIIEDAALNYDDMEEQTNAAHDSIREQLREMGVYEVLAARQSQKQMDASTPPATPSSPMPRP